MQTKVTSLIRFWCCLLGMICLPVFLVPAQTFEQVWQLGLEDNSINEFSQESFAQNEPPGSPTVKDNDYYFAGEYAAVGPVAQDEPWLNFERALTGSELRSRIHFNLTPGQAAAGNNLRVTFKLFSFNNDPTYSIAPVPSVTAKWNDTEVLNYTDVTDPTTLQATFVAGDVGATAGENLLTIERSPEGNAWIQFDYVRAEVELLDPTAGLIESFKANAAHIFPGQKAILSWKTDPQANLVIDQGVGDVSGQTVDGIGSIEVSPTETTTYTLTSTKGQYSLTSTVTVMVSMITKFTITPGSIRIDDPVTLAWEAAPEATLVIDNGVGSVNAQTVNGVGSIKVYPSADTTYTLTATRGDQSAEMSVNVTVNPLKLLWQLGYDDNQNSDFHQEGGGANPTPGSPTAIDNDYYFAGQYPDPIGFLSTNEPWGNFERALTIWGDDTTRIHFNLTEAQAAAGNNIYVTFRMYGFNTDAVCCNVDPTADMTVKWNDTEVLSTTSISDPTIVQIPALVAGDIGAVPGANVLTISRTAAGNAWIQFDYVRAEVETLDPTAGLITAFDANLTRVFPGQPVTLSWKTDPAATLTIDQGIGSVAGQTVNGIGSIQVSPNETTTYTLTSTKGAATISASVRVVVAMINSFTASGTSIKTGESVTLNWDVDPAATVSLAPTFGDMSARTTAGVGSFTVAPQANTTYTLTVTRSGFSAQASVTVIVNPFMPLWQVGYEDNSQAEFAAENSSVNLPPGSPTAADNDYYFAGQYAEIGLVETTEPVGNFERAIKPSDYVTRIHFNLTPAQAASDNLFRVTFRLFGFNTDPAYPLGNLSWVTAKWNDIQVLTNADIADPTILQATFVAGDVGAAVGENLLTIERSATGNEWVQFDYIKAEYFNPNSRAWELGYADNQNADFHQEGGGVNPLPGSPTALDNDYYFAGTYAALNPPLVQRNEAWANFERALTSWDVATRIHFNLTAVEAAPDNVLNLTFKLYGFNTDPGYPMDPVPWVTAKWNDTEVLNNVDVTDPTTMQATFAVGDAGAVAGENVLTIERSPQGNAWIQFDYINVEVTKTGAAGGLRMTESGWDAFGFTIMWNSVPGRTYQVLTSTDLKTWTPLVDSYLATDVWSSYTDKTATPGIGKRFYQIVDNSPAPIFADNFESGMGGWEVDDQSLTGTTWELGEPVNGPGAAHSGSKVFGTGLTSIYYPETQVFLRSPVINLTGVTNATLQFWEYRDIESPQGEFLPDYGAVEIVDENGELLPDLPVVYSKGGVNSGWRMVSVALPAAALDRTIRLQFHFASDTQTESVGWFIDDVKVLPK